MLVAPWQRREQFCNRQIAILAMLNKVHVGVKSAVLFMCWGANQATDCVPCFLIVEVCADYDWIIRCREHATGPSLAGQLAYYRLSKPPLTQQHALRLGANRRRILATSPYFTHPVKEDVKKKFSPLPSR